MWLIIKLIQALMGLHVTCKNEEDPFKNEGARVVTKYLPLKIYLNFDDAHSLGWFYLKFKHSKF